MAGNMADLGAALNNTNAVAATLAAAATSALHNANGAAGVATHDPSTSAARSAFSFRQWASDLGLRRFADLIGEAGLADLIDTSMTPLTIFAPTDDAIARLGSQRPAEAEQLRELMCVHLVSTGQLCAAELLVEKSITTIGQQPHPNPSPNPDPNPDPNPNPNPGPKPTPNPNQASRRTTSQFWEVRAMALPGTACRWP